MSRTIKLEQAQIALDDIGDGDPVLLLHGFPATRHWVRVFSPTFSPNTMNVRDPGL
jgi:pimeloyl-ACP methyl ester carboxylesterase